MNMEMTLKDKIKAVVSVIEEARSIQKTNPVYIPVEYFSPSNLGFPNVRDVFRVLREQGTLKKNEKLWGYDEIHGNKRNFVKTSPDEAQTEDDYVAYEIAFDEKKFSNQLSAASRAARSEIEFDSQNGVIFFGRIKHAFQKGREGQLRLNLFKVLWEDRKVIKNGKERPKGNLFPAYALAVQLGFAKDKRDYENSLEVKDKLDNLLKNTERTFQNKGIPIRLYQKGGVQIAVEL